MYLGSILLPCMHYYVCRIGEIIWIKLILFLPFSIVWQPILIPETLWRIYSELYGDTVNNKHHEWESMYFLYIKKSNWSATAIVSSNPHTHFRKQQKAKKLSIMEIKNIKMFYVVPTMWYETRVLLRLRKIS